MQVIEYDEINWAEYETETDAKQNCKAAGIWIDAMIDDFLNPLRVPRVLMPWAKTHGNFDFRTGEVTIWGGANGHGKSLVTGQVALSLMAQGQKCCIASFEMKPTRTLERMFRQWSGYNPHDPMFSMDEAKKELVDLYQQFKDWSGSLWLYDQQGTVQTKQVAAVARYCAKELGVKHFFVDSLMKCVSGEDDFNGQKAFVDELTAIARDYQMHIHLIHHIRKPQNEDHRPNKYDYKGSGSITDQVDNVVSVWRNKAKERKRQENKAVDESEPDCILICDKQRNGEWEGQIGLWFHRESQQFLNEPGTEPMIMYRHPQDV